ncbi:MAG: DUF92 domain-containing protein [Spirochaetes bacterium]|nr:DUF92 domain-containing protein [Spirochaetota bacterium]MBU0956874.1 DUF92 domain-containing protein [Spirochaetota bacterium]
MITAERLAWGIFLNSIVAILAWKRRGVTISGALAGFTSGVFILVVGGWIQWLLLMTFFVSSMLAGRYKRSLKQKAESMHSKGYRRDAVQVLANAGPSMLFILLSLLHGDKMLTIAAAGFAAATADTWAGELGMLSKKAPVSILTGKPVAKGTSGGVSPLGFAFSFSGSLLIALVYTLATGLSRGFSATSLVQLLVISLGGFIGSVIDSLLGASVQAKYRCSQTGEMTEKARSGHLSNQLVSGAALMTNDLVNFLATAGSASLGMLLLRLL